MTPARMKEIREYLDYRLRKGCRCHGCSALRDVLAHCDQLQANFAAAVECENELRRDNVELQERIEALEGAIAKSLIDLEDVCSLITDLPKNTSEIHNEIHNIRDALAIANSGKD